MKEARKVIEQLEVDREIAIAEVKKQVHEEMELKDQELRDIRQQCVNLQEESKIYTEKVDKLEKSSQFLINIYLKGLWYMVFNDTFNNISFILWWSVLLVEETRVPGEIHRPAANHAYKIHLYEL